jgi:hypothetical protein
MDNLDGLSFESLDTGVELRTAKSWKGFKIGI